MELIVSIKIISVDKHFNSAEEVIADELFLAWYFRTDETKSKAWEVRLLENQRYIPLVEEAIQFLKSTYVQENAMSQEQVELAHSQLQSSLDSAKLIEMKPKRKRLWIPAAAILVFAIAGWMLLKNDAGKTTMESAFGTIREYQLPDGSQVTLNANSNITTSKDWKGGKDREVWLQGEAFFNIQKTATKDRFIVHTKNLDIIVTGTQFNVISRDDESSVLLTEGSVIIKTKEGREIPMKPGDFVVMQNNVPAIQPADQDKILAWKQSRLDFDKTPMKEVVKIIARHYGVKVTIADQSIEEKTISGLMPNDNLDVLIQALEATGDYKITRVGKEITISNP